MSESENQAEPGYDFYHRVEIRASMRNTLIGFGVALVLLAALAVAVYQWLDDLFPALLVVGCPAMGMLFILPFALQGGAYTVFIRDGVLRAESPQPKLGTRVGNEFEVKLDAITKTLYLNADSDDPLDAAVQTREGTMHYLNTRFGGSDALPITKLFAVIEQLTGIQPERE